MSVGTEWLVDARGCRAESLRDLAVVRALLESILARLDLRVIGEGAWHKFGGEGGITGLYLLTESHLSVHTYPEHGIATFNLYCCHPRPDFPWAEEIARALGSGDLRGDVRVDVRIIARGGDEAETNAERRSR
jgi:S-adenosylmethionine decarboxylase